MLAVAVQQVPVIRFARDRCLIERVLATGLETRFSNDRELTFHRVLGDVDGARVCVTDFLTVDDRACRATFVLRNQDDSRIDLNESVRSRQHTRAHLFIDIVDVFTRQCSAVEQVRVSNTETGRYRQPSSDC